MGKTNNQIGRSSFSTSNYIFNLSDLMENEIETIVIDNELFAAFRGEARTKKNFKNSQSIYLFKYVVYLYNDNIESNNLLDSLTYLEKVVEALETLTPSEIMELSLDKLTDVLDSEDSAEMLKKYKQIKRKRQDITSSHYTVYREMLIEHHNTFKGKHDVFDMIAKIYNENSILKDKVDYLKYLNEMAKISKEKIANMRMLDILELFNIRDVNYETINESERLINDLKSMNLILC